MRIPTETSRIRERMQTPGGDQNTGDDQNTDGSQNADDQQTADKNQDGSGQKVENSDAPRTGDTTAPAVYGGLALAALMVAVASVKRAKRR